MNFNGGGMNENIVVEDRHIMVPLSDEEFKDAKILALDVGSLKRWVRQAIVEKINKDKEN